MAAELPTGEIIPKIGLGTWNSKSNDLVEAIVEAIRVGYRHIDCAYGYDNEAQVAEGLKKAFDLRLVKREELFITSKLWNTRHSPADVRPSVEESLSLLGLEYLDLYLMHWPHAFKPGKVNFPKNDDGTVQYADIHYNDTWKAMESCVDAGLVRAIGVSNFNKQQIQDVIDNCRIKPANVQVELHPYFSQTEIVTFCKANNITITAYSPFSSPGRAMLKAPTETNIFQDVKLKQIAENHHRSVAQIILRWAHQRDIIAIPKSVNPSRIQENIKIYDFELNDEDMSAINSLNTNIRRLVPLAERDGKYVYRDLAAPHYPFKEGE